MTKIIVDITNAISNFFVSPIVYPAIFALITIAMFIIYQRFYSMSCDNNECMKWVCVDENKKFEYKLVSKSGIGIAKSVILAVIILGFVSIAFTIYITMDSTGKFAEYDGGRTNITIFTLLMGFIYFLLVWWSRTCGLDDSNKEIPVMLQCNGNTVEWTTKYTKISGLFIFLIIFFISWELLNVLKPDKSGDRTYIPLPAPSPTPNVQSLPSPTPNVQSLPSPTQRTWLREEIIPSGGQKRARGKYKSKK